MTGRGRLCVCGIFGLLSFENNKLDEERFATALTTLQHRGPDGQRTLRIDERAIFGHTRLSIIDLSHASDQPMLLLGRYVLTYNGEIFNYLELRAELEREGVQFETSGDVEVLLRAYIAWGEDCTNRFNGMWAFAIYDKQEQTLFCSRDRFGIKPFNYSLHDGKFLFASEIKAILAYAPDLVNPDYGMISNFCRSSVGAQHERTWFRDVRRLMPGCNMVVTACPPSAPMAQI
jgi:asparagine synthase (glutamine-hydrolysing)